MKILFTAPQPFYQVRGTPIAVELLVKHLADRGHQIDLLVFNEGEDRDYEGVTLHRVKSFPAVSNVKPGFSLKKIWLDFWMFLLMVKMMIKNKYDVVHSVEESVFIAMILRPIFRYKYVYDMDSSMTTQLLDKAPALNKVGGLFRAIESLPMRFADAVAPVCDLLADEVKKYRQSGIFIIKDISFSSEDASQTENTSTQTTNLREMFESPELPLFMYIGNLEAYQGIDLMLDGFAKALATGADANLMIIGGEDSDISYYSAQCDSLGVSSNTVFAGKMPLDTLFSNMEQSDCLVSPRVHGINTPMKIYSYLDSGKPVLATNRLTHTQVMNDEISVLVEPNVDEFAQAMVEIIENPAKYKSMAAAAAAYIKREHSAEAFARQADALYKSLENAGT